MRRRRFTREFKVEAVKLVRERGVSVAQAGRDLDVHENVLRKWVKEVGFPVAWLCDALGVSRSGFHAWLTRSPSARSRSDEELGGKVKASFAASDRTYGARRVWRDLLADGADCGLHRGE